ncbi:hypothetical protein [Acetilactobacillus jinshanensis]|uniref:hypothetical protein n=1 Tax=Acetilactobacillus jinshanensis TaxID=1720083 RepID=UPI0013A63754|nr:hypothetical protein [Acetilactobacillus jinshanensis]URL61294.1 hypothetical protein HGK75_04680 [uncultured bacterium]
MMFLKSLQDSLKSSHHKLGTLSLLTLLCILNHGSDKSGDADRYQIQTKLHQTE